MTTSEQGPCMGQQCAEDCRRGRQVLEEEPCRVWGLHSVRVANSRVVQCYAEQYFSGAQLNAVVGMVLMQLSHRSTQHQRHEC